MPLPSVLAFNPGHDGAVAHLSGQELVFSLEGEKDSQARHSNLKAELLLEAIRRTNGVPDIVSIGGWNNDGLGVQEKSAGYEGVADDVTSFRALKLFGQRTTLFESTHERSHLFCSYGLSPFDEGEPCYALLWEGRIGSFYEIDEKLKITKLDEVMRAPGYKFSFLYDLADPSKAHGGWTHDAAGKLMALGAYSSKGLPSIEEEQAIQKILGTVAPPKTLKTEFSGSRYLNCGVTDKAFIELVGKFSARLFDIFFQYARRNLTKQWPLLIAGGCGLNCEWNTLWRDSNLFRDVFVPPVPNDSGSAIGTAIDAQHMSAGPAKIRWSVYSGLEFEWDQQPIGVDEHDLDFDVLARFLSEGNVVAWVQGKYEIGPRALGNRSLLAAPFSESMTGRLNKIKRRETFRPVASVCLEGEMHRCFEMSVTSPHMLYFMKTAVPELRAVTHVDGTCRVQTVSRDQNEPLFELLNAFKRRTGFGVLCNTSLNFPGRGFINRSSDLFKFVRTEGLDAAVVGNKVFTRSAGRGSL